MVTFAGAIGIGLVWGWLMGMWAGPARQSVRAGNLIIFATAAMGGVIFSIGNAQLLAWFLVSEGLSFSLHLLWRRGLARRAGSIHSHGGKP
jgi:hypothetical protein